MVAGQHGSLAAAEGSRFRPAGGDRTSWAKAGVAAAKAG